MSGHYGEGNVGSFCTPVSTTGTAEGSFIDGVQLGTNNNTGTGGSAGPTYTNYSAQFSTALSRDALTGMNITTGAKAGDRYSAWIDFDRNGSFALGEKIGEFINDTPGEVRTIFFIVPADATAANGSSFIDLVLNQVVEPACIFDVGIRTEVGAANAQIEPNGFVQVRGYDRVYLLKVAFYPGVECCALRAGLPAAGMADGGMGKSVGNGF